MRTDSRQTDRQDAAAPKSNTCTDQLQALKAPGDWGSQISQSVHEGGKTVSPTHRLPLPRKKYSWYSFMLHAESLPGP